MFGIYSRNQVYWRFSTVESILRCVCDVQLTTEKLELVKIFLNVNSLYIYFIELNLKYKILNLSADSFDLLSAPFSSVFSTNWSLNYS